MLRTSELEPPPLECLGLMATAWATVRRPLLQMARPRATPQVRDNLGSFSDQKLLLSSAFLWKEALTFEKAQWRVKRCMGLLCAHQHEHIIPQTVTFPQGQSSEKEEDRSLDKV